MRVVRAAARTEVRAGGREAGWHDQLREIGIGSSASAARRRSASSASTCVVGGRRCAADQVRGATDAPNVGSNRSRSTG